jgi:hypothetical protein
MLAAQQWQRDYGFSLQEDEKVIAALSGYGYSAWHTNELLKNSSFDAVLAKDGKAFLAEFKHDKIALSTNRVFIETASKSGVPSGLSVTGATHYFICLPQIGLAFAIKTAALKSLLPLGIEKSAPTQGYLLPLELIAERSSAIFNYGEAL